MLGALAVSIITVLSALSGSEALVVAKLGANATSGVGPAELLASKWLALGAQIARGDLILQPASGTLGAPGIKWSTFGSGTTCRSKDGKMNAHKVRDLPDSMACARVCEVSEGCYGFEFRKMTSLYKSSTMCFLASEPIAYAKKLTMEDAMAEYVGSPSILQAMADTMVVDSLCSKLDRAWVR